MQVLAKLKSAEGALRALGVGELYLYGSVARDEADGESDVDLFMEPGAGPAARLPRVHAGAGDAPRHFRHVRRLHDRDALHPMIVDEAEREAVRVF